MLSKERLKGITLFKALSDEELDIVSSFLEEEFYKKGSHIWEENAPAQGLHVIDSGKVKISRMTREGHRQVLAVLKQNQFFGELSLLDGRTHSASAEAVEDTKVFILHGDKMEELLRKNPQTAYNIMRALGVQICELLRQMNAKFMDMVNYVWE